MHEPGSRDFPIAFHRDHRYAEGVRDVSFQKTAEEAEFNDAGCSRVGSGEVVQRFVEIQQVLVVSHRIPTFDGGQAELLLMTAPLFAVPATRMIDQHAAHGLRSEGEEMCAILIRDGIAGGEAEPPLVKQSLGIQRVSRAFIAKETGGDPFKLGVKRVDNACAGGRVPTGPGSKPGGDFRRLRCGVVQNS